MPPRHTLIGIFGIAGILEVGLGIVRVQTGLPRDLLGFLMGLVFVVGWRWGCERVVYEESLGYWSLLGCKLDYTLARRVGAEAGVVGEGYVEVG